MKLYEAEQQTELAMEAKNAQNALTQLKEKQRRESRKS